MFDAQCDLAALVYGPEQDPDAVLRGFAADLAARGFRAVGMVQAGACADSSLSAILLPGGEKPFADSAGAEIFVDLEGDDVPDHFEGTEADLSDLIVETLSLAIDPYPRAAGESIEDLGIAGDDPAEDSPFARLRALKSPGDKGP